MKLLVVACVSFLVVTVSSLQLDDCGTPEGNFTGLNVTNCQHRKNDTCIITGNKLYLEIKFKPHRQYLAGYIQVSAWTDNRNIFQFFPLFLDDLIETTGFRRPILENKEYSFKLDVDLSKPKPKFFDTPVTIIFKIQGDHDIGYIMCYKFRIIKEPCDAEN